MDDEGILYVHDIYNLITKDVGLTLDDIDISYTTYVNNYHPKYTEDGRPTIQDAVDNDLTPGKVSEYESN